MLPLNPLYEVVPVSEPPVVDGIYMTKWKGVPAWTEKEFKDGRWQTQFDWTGLLTHYLRPLPPERMEEWVREIVKRAWRAAIARQYWNDEMEGNSCKPDLKQFTDNIIAKISNNEKI